MSGIAAGFIAAAVRPVKISNQSANGAVVAGGTSTARYQLLNTGSATRTVNGSNTAISGEWLLSGTVAQFDARGTFSAVSGGTTGGPTTYTNLATSQAWTLQSTNTDQSATLTIEIVRTGTSSPVLATAVISMATFGSP